MLPVVNLTKTGNVRVWTFGQGPPLLYLHGFEQHPGRDAPFLHRLAQQRTVHAPEHHGYGESSGLDEIRDIFDVVLHLRCLVESWKHERIDVVGHSLGGMFAAEFAALCPHLVRRLVLVDAFGLWLDDEPAIDPFTLTADELAASKWYDPSRAPTPEPSAFAGGDDPVARAAFDNANLGAATKFLWPLPDRGLRRRAPYIQAPTLVLHGESDGLVPPAYGMALAGLIPDARFELISGAGHLPMIEAEEQFFARLEDFMDLPEGDD